MIGDLVAVLIDVGGTYIVGIMADASVITLKDPARLIMEEDGSYAISKFSVIQRTLVIPDSSVVAYGLASDSVIKVHKTLYNP